MQSIHSRILSNIQTSTSWWWWRMSVRSGNERCTGH